MTCEVLKNYSDVRIEDHELMRVFGLAAERALSSAVATASRSSSNKSAYRSSVIAALACFGEADGPFAD